MTQFAATCRYAGKGPRPPRSCIVPLLEDLERRCRSLGFRPVGITLQTWKLGDDINLVKIIVAVEPGELGPSLRSFYEWSHPSWRWSSAPLPTLALPAEPAPQPVMEAPA